MKIISLFAGAGGLDVAAKLAGGDVVCAIDNDPDSIATLRLNSEGSSPTQHVGDVTQLTGVDVLKLARLKRNERFFMMGGPPCQSFSKNNYWTKSGEESQRRKIVRQKKAASNGETFLGTLDLPKTKSRVDVAEDERTSLVMEYARLIGETMPVGFLFENVASIRHPRNKPYLDEFKHSCEQFGYRVSEFLLSSENFGVAQKRKRVFVVGHIEKTIDAPSETHSSEPSILQQPVIGVREVIDRFRFKKYFEPDEEISGRWSKYLPDIPPGMNYKALTAWAGYSNPVFEAETRFWNFLLKLHPDKPSWTIASSPGPWIGPFHWKNRRLRTVEMAAIQSFSPDYKFCGSRRSVVRQIGNAVPPLMGRAVLEKLLER